MSKFLGNMILSFVVVGGAIILLRSLPDLARYLELRDM
jgi:Family of unknown function (DUF6893)